MQPSLQFETHVGGGESSDNHIGFGIGLDEILGVFVSNLNHVVTHEISVEHIDFV